MYQRVAEHPGYAEEALLRIARIQIDLGEPWKALRTLERARERIGSKGQLVPERTRVEVRLLITARRFEDAAEVSKSFPDLRLEVASAWVELEPQRALRLISDIESPEADRVRARAKKE